MSILTLSPPAQSFQRTLKTTRSKTRSPFTLSTNQQDWGGAAWEFSIKVVEMEAGAIGRELGGTLDRLAASGESFLLRDPTVAQLSFGLQVIELLEFTAAGSLTLKLEGLTPQKFVVGDFLSISRGSGFWDFHRVVEIVADLGSGVQHVSIRPSLRRDYNAGTEIEAADPLVTVALEPNGGLPQNFTYPFQVNYTFAAFEVF